jgi:peptidyl-prolyl cis-trans isomerase D
MLQSFKDRLRGSPWLGYVIVGVISVPFALWGIQAYVGGGADNAVAAVNGDKIPAHQVERQVAQRRQMLQQRFGGELPEMFDTAMLRQQVVQQMISRRLLEQVARDANLQVGADTLSRAIRGQSTFQQIGEFSRELYQQRLSRAGLSPEQYEARVRDRQRRQQLQQGVRGSAFVLPGEAERIARLQGEERLVSSLQYPRAAARERVELDAGAVEQYYSEHKARYRSPEKVKLAYIEMDLEALAEQVELSEQEVREAFEANQQQTATKDARKAAHILIQPQGDGDNAREQARAKARRLRQQLVNGEAAFAALAREHSDDPGSAEQGGGLGFVQRGSMVEPFSEALFALDEVGAVSEPVRTTYGYHLIKLLDKREAEQRSFAAVREQLAAELRRSRAQERFYERAEVLRNSAYENPGSLKPVAEATGLEIRESGWISQQGQSEEGIGQYQPVRKAAFSEAVLGQRQNSEVLELGERRVAVVRVVAHREPQPRPLSEVRGQVRSALIEDRVNERLRAWSEQAVSRLQAGAAPETLAKPPVKRVDHGWVAQSAEDLGRALAQAAFEMPPPGRAEARPNFEAITLNDGGRAIVLVRETRLPQVAGEKIAELRSQRNERLSAGEFQAWMTALRADADIQRFDQEDGSTQAASQ